MFPSFPSSPSLMMTSAFASPVLLPSTSRYSTLGPLSEKSRSVRCTAAPERARVSKVSLPKYHRVLPKNLPVSERPPPVPRHYSIPFIGFFIENFLGAFDKNPNIYHEKYGPIYLSNFFLTDILYLNSYGAAAEILKADTKFVLKDSFPGSEDLLGDDVVSALDGKDHEVARAVLGPAFSPTLFPYYLKNVVKRTRATWKRVEDTVKKDGSAKFDPIFREHYLGITIEMTTGVKFNSERSSHIRSLFADFSKAFTIPRFLPGWKRGQAAKEEVLAILREVILENLSNRSDVINKLREYGDDIVKLGNKDIVNGDVDVLLVTIANSTLSTDKNAPLDEELIGSLCRSMLLLWFAGYVTSAVTSTCASFELGFREDLLAKLVKEQDEIGDSEVTYEQVISKMPLLDAYLMEILRIYPAASPLTRRTVKDTEILGKFVPAGTRILISLSRPQRSDENYRDAQDIIPERWLQKPKPTPILTFGAPGSPHYCIGAAFSKMMMKVTFASLLREYEYKLDPKQSRNYRQIPDNSPESGVRVIKFQTRSHLTNK